MMACRGISASTLRIAALVTMVAAMIFALAMGWHNAITLENIVLVRDRFHLVLSQHPVVSVLIYIAIYATSASLSLPGGLIFTLTGGLMFGWLLGGMAAVVAAFTGAVVVFLIVSSAMGDAQIAGAAGKLARVPSVSSHLERIRRLDKLLEQMRAGFRKDALSYLLFLRFIPAFPFWAVNLVAAVLGVPFKTYVIATFFGIMPATFAFASLGAGLDSVIARAKAEHAACVTLRGAEACELKIHIGTLITKELVLAFVLLGFAALVPVAYKKWRKSHAE